jgi:hypothetical protein
MHVTKHYQKYMHDNLLVAGEQDSGGAHSESLLPHSESLLPHSESLLPHTIQKTIINHMHNILLESRDQHSDDKHSEYLLPHLLHVTVFERERKEKQSGGEDKES